MHLHDGNQSKNINLSIKELTEICDHLPVQQGKEAYESLKVPQTSSQVQTEELPNDDETCDPNLKLLFTSKIVCRRKCQLMQV